MLKLFELVLAVLGGWDIARRLLPFRVPIAAGELACAGLAILLLKWAAPTIILALCVPGGIMVLSAIVSPEPHSPWGPQVMEMVRIYRQRHRHGMREAPPPVRKIGNRIPRL